MRDKIWAKFVMNVTYLSNIIPLKSSLKCPFELLYGVKPTVHDNLKVFGEGGLITRKVRINDNLRN
jgi:hypothetical protein